MKKFNFKKSEEVLIFIACTLAVAFALGKVLDIYKYHKENTVTEWQYMKTPTAIGDLEFHYQIKDGKIWVFKNIVYIPNDKTVCEAQGSFNGRDWIPSKVFGQLFTGKALYIRCRCLPFMEKNDE